MSKPGNEISLYERIGRAPAITAAVDRFYDRVLADPELKNFFNGVSRSRLKAHQFAFLSQALGARSNTAEPPCAMRIPGSRSSSGILMALLCTSWKRFATSASPTTLSVPLARRSSRSLSRL